MVGAQTMASVHCFFCPRTFALHHGDRGEANRAVAGANRARSERVGSAVSPSRTPGKHLLQCMSECRGGHITPSVAQHPAAHRAPKAVD